MTLLKSLLSAALLLGVGTLDVMGADLGSQLAVISNKGIKIDTVTKSDLVRYFKAEKSKASDGTKLVIVMFDVGKVERAAALTQIYGMSETEFTDYFVEATFTGEVTAAPKALPSSAAVKKYVSETAGALGYVRASEVDDSVKVLKVDGKAPGEPGYTLAIK